MYRDIDAAELAGRLGTDTEPLVLDVRDPDEVAEWAIPGSINIPVRELDRRIDELPRDREVVTVCASGNRSAVRRRPARPRRLAGREPARRHGGLGRGVRLGRVEARRRARRPGAPAREGLPLVRRRRHDGDEAFVIDPSIDADVYFEIAAEHGWRIAHVFDTHLHADHLSGARALADRAQARRCTSTPPTRSTSRSPRCTTATGSRSAAASSCRSRRCGRRDIPKARRSTSSGTASC